MQGNLLFVGCSHTNGFWGQRHKDGTLDKYIGDKNNYAQIYSNELADGRCYIYSSAGASNNKYPRWIRHMTNTHKDIKGIFVQSTYWDRWVMAADVKQHHRTIEVGHFCKTVKEEEKFIFYDDWNTTDFDVVEWFEKVKWASVGNYTEGCPEFNGGYNWIGFDTNYMHMKFHTDIATHLKTEEYLKDIALIDAMVNVPVYVWRINDRTQRADTLDVYKTLNNVIHIETPASIWIKENLNIDIETMTLDEEHYNEEAHRLIAHHFIPEVLNGTT
jgi:hypothetical protein